MRTTLLAAALALFAPAAGAQSVVPGDPGAIPPPKVEPRVRRPAVPGSGTGLGTDMDTNTDTGKDPSLDPGMDPGTFDANVAEAKAVELSTPVGLWRTIDDQTGKARSLVRIVDTGNGVLVGRVEKILDPVYDVPDAVCKRCDDDRRNQPIIGLEIIRGLKPHGRSWADGRILNPEDGKIYHLKATPAEAGTKLEMRGYIGLPIFGRSQTWIREP